MLANKGGASPQVEGYDKVYDGSSMLFMDFRRHHSGVWAGTAPRCPKLDLLSRFKKGAL